MDELNSWVDFLRKDLTEVVSSGKEIGSIYISSLPSAQNLPLLQENKIKSVLSVAKGVRLTQVSTHLKSHLVLQAEDQPYFDLSQFFDQSYTFIEEGRKHGNVLVHCMAGISRSATLVAMYLMRKEGTTAEDAVERLKMRRKQVNPNSGFMEQLTAEQKRLGISKANFNKNSKVAQTIRRYQNYDEVKMDEPKKYSTIQMVDELLSKLPVPLVTSATADNNKSTKAKKEKEEKKQAPSVITEHVRVEAINETARTIDSCIQTEDLEKNPSSFMIDRVRTQQDKSPQKQDEAGSKTPPFDEYSKGNPFDSISFVNNSSFTGKIVNQRQRLSLSNNRKERVKNIQSKDQISNFQSSSVTSSPSTSRAKSKTESKIDKLKASMVGLCKSKEYNQTIFNKLMENKSIYKNKLRIR